MVDSIKERKAKAKEIIENLKRIGRKVYEIPLGGASAISTIGFVLAMYELAEQMRISNIEIDHLFFSSSTGGTHAGMLIGAKLFGFENLRIVGISPEPEAKAEIVSEVERLLTEVGDLLEIETSDLYSKIEIFDQYAGEGYCLETAEGNEAFKLLAELKRLFSILFIQQRQWRD